MKESDRNIEAGLEKFRLGRVNSSDFKSIWKKMDLILKLGANIAGDASFAQGFALRHQFDDEIISLKKETLRCMARDLECMASQIDSVEKYTKELLHGQG